jgi:CRISPR system Cascade subunit CasB
MDQTEKWSFSATSKARALLLDWWHGLEESRGERAELRRATTPTEVAFSPAFHRLLHDFRQGLLVSAESLAVVAGVVVHAKAHDDSSVFAAQMAAPKSAGGSAAVSDLRFRRLLQIADRPALYQPLVRTIRLLGGSVNIVSLADDIYFWSDHVRRNWAYNYYEKAPSKS